MCSKQNRNLSMFNMITGIIESKSLTKHVSCECKCKFDGRNVIQMKSEIMKNADTSLKNIMYAKRLSGILLYVLAKII